MKMLKETTSVLKKYNTGQNVERFWTYSVCVFFLFLAGALLYSSWLFSRTTNALDEQVLPSFESNTSILRDIESNLTIAEDAVDARTGIEKTTSQKALEVIE